MKQYQKKINLIIIAGLLFSPITTYAMEKNETIYSTLKSDGNRDNTTVSNHLSWLEEGDINDDTELKNILNIGGSEEFTKKENNLSWKSKGNDIYYRGETEKELPIKTEIKYFFNGEEKKVEEILGKSGKIQIQIRFQNQLKNSILINRNVTELYTPFVTMVGTTLNSKENKNIKINNGKVVGTGNRYTLIGIAAPGLYDSLKLKELENLNEITLSYETTNFSLNTIYIVSTPKLLEENDLKIFDKMNELYQNMQELQENMNQLEDGANKLAKGANKLNNGTKELENGIQNALEGIKKLQIASKEMENGLSQAVSKLNQIEKIISNINIAGKLQQLTDLQNANTNTINALTKTNTNFMQTLNNQNLDITKKEETLFIDLQNAFNAGLIDKNQMNQIILIKKTYDGNKQMISLLNLNNQAIKEILNNLKTITPQLNDLTNGINQLKKALKGANELNQGINVLQTGIQTIYNATGKLSIGTKELSNGANTLSEGTSLLNNQGIKKLNNYTHSLKNYNDKIEALINLSHEYNGFTSKNSNNTNFVSVVKSEKITYQK